MRVLTALSLVEDCDGLATLDALDSSSLSGVTLPPSSHPMISAALLMYEAIFDGRAAETDFLDPSTLPSILSSCLPNSPDPQPWMDAASHPTVKAVLKNNTD